MAVLGKPQTARAYLVKAALGPSVAAQLDCGPQAAPRSAFIEEPIGTDLPDVVVGAPVVLWTLGPKTVAYVASALLDCS